MVRVLTLSFLRFGWITKGILLRCHLRILLGVELYSEGLNPREIGDYE
jgi:hypothetical protein